MVDYPIRAVTLDEHAAFVRASSAAFGSQPAAEEPELFRPIFEPERSLAAFDGDRMVTTAGALSFDLTLPGLTTVSAAGVTFVGVLPTYRRRGLLRALMRRQLDDVRQRGEPLAILTASESLLYGRFGYGMATQSVALEIDRRHAVLSHAADGPGTVELIEREAAATALPVIYDRARCLQPGALTRSEGYWTVSLHDLEAWRDGASALFFAVYRSPAGQADGYVSYRIQNKWEHGLSQGSLRVNELIAATPEAYAALWAYCLSMDLVVTVQTNNSALDEPLRWMLRDPRRLRVTRQSDFLWLRLLDVPAALTARCYMAQDTLTLRVDDPFMPALAGCYTLEASPHGADCQATTRAPDLRLDVADLGSAYLGGARCGALAYAGRVTELTPGALRRADALFASDPPPWCGTSF